MSAVLPQFDCLSSAIREMNSDFPRPTFKIEVGKEFDLQSDYNNLSKSFSNKVGVYILFNESKDIIRIGSSIDDLYRRLNTYFDYKSDDNIVGVGWWKEGVGSRYIRVIEVPGNCSFEALAIEQFLIRKLCPPLNKEGKLKYLDYRKSMLNELDRLSTLYGWERVSKNWYTA